MADKVVVVRLRAAVGEYTSGLARAGGQTVSFAGKVATAAKVSDSAVAKSRRTLSQLANGAALVGKLMLAGVGGAMVVSAKAAIDFESSLAGVAKTVEGTDTQIRAIGESMRDLSLRIPVNVNELNKIAELGGQLGVGIPQLKDFTEVIAALGVTTNLSTEDAAKGIARLANVTGTSTDDFDMLGSVIVELGNNFETTESEILTFALRIAPVARVVGVSAAEVLGLSAALSSLGVAAERGGTAMQRVFTQIDIAIKGGGTQLESFADITGLTTAAFVELAEADMTEALVQVAEGLKRIDDEGGNAFQALDNVNISGVRAQQTMLALSGSTEDLRNALETATTEAEEQDALWEEAGRRYGTTASEIRLMANAFTDLRIEIGQEMLPGIRDVVQTIGALFQVMKENVGVVKAVGTVLAGIGFALAAIGINKMFTAMFLFVGQVRTAITTLGALRTGMGLTAAASAAAGTVMSLGLTLVLGGLAFAAFNAAKKMAQLRANADEFLDAVEQGTDPTEAFLNVLDPENLERASVGFENIGVGVQEIAEAGANLDLAKLEATKELLEALLDAEVQRQAAAGHAATTPFITADNIEEMDAIGRAMAINAEAIATAEQIIADRSREMALAVLGAVPNVRTGLVGITEAAANFVRNNPFATDEEFINFFTGDAWELYAGGAEGAARSTKVAAEQAEIAAQSWGEYLRTIGEVDAQGDFLDDAEEAAIEWAEKVADAIDDVRESLQSGAPAWDEYEQTTLENIDGIIDAWKLYSDDLAAWAAIQPAIFDQASQPVKDYFNDLDAAELGALGRLWADAPEQMQTDLARLETVMNTAFANVETITTGRVPGIIQNLEGEITPAIQGLVDGLNLPTDEMQTDAYEQGIRTFMLGIPTWLKPLAQEHLSTGLDMGTGPASVTYVRGFESGKSFLEGFVTALKNANLEVFITQTLTEPVVNTIESDWRQKSPSLVAKGLGTNFMEGLFLGMDETFSQSDLPTQRIVPSIQGMLAGANANSSQQQMGGPQIHFNGNVDSREEVADSVQKGLLLSGLMQSAEVTPGG